MTNILFICKYNRFRSRIAEAYFNKKNKSKNLKAKSAGIVEGAFLDKEQYEIAKEFGLDISGPTKPISRDLLKWQDIMIIVANNIPEGLFKDIKYRKKVIFWKIPDVTINNRKEIIKIIKLIIKKVDTLIKGEK